MLEEYDIDKLSPRANPYVGMLKKQNTIRVSTVALDYSRSKAAETGTPHRTLIDMYLVNCAKNERMIEWK